MTAFQGPDHPTASDYLNEAERDLLKAAATGTLVDLRTGDTDLDNPANAADWGDDRTVRAGFLADLLTGDQPTSMGRVRSVKLAGARVTGTLDLEARTLRFPVWLEDCYFDEAVNLSQAEAISIRLPGCHVPGINATQLRTAGSVHFSSGFIVRGETRLGGAHIGGQLSFSGATLTNDKGPALVASSITVHGGVYCANSFTARGEVQLPGSHIGGQLDLSGATLTNDKGPALVAYGLTVDQDMLCAEGFTAQGGIDLRNAKVGMFYDDSGSWPDEIWIRGFSYEGLGNESVGIRARLQWLRRHGGPFTPQIYDQLADVYRRAGDDSSARKVLIAKQRRRRGPYDPLSWLWYVTVGYGYRTWQAFIWATALMVTGALVFSGVYPAHVAAQTAHPPRFQPIIYTLDVMLPIGGLGQKSAWQPTGGYLDWYWVLAIAGWILSAAVVAGLTGILKRD